MRLTLPFFFFCLTYSSLTFGADEKSVIERINTAESVPVFIILGEVTSDKYNAQFGKVSLTPSEISADRIASTVPKEFDSLMPFLVNRLNEQFKTTKFVPGITGSKNEITNYIFSKNLSFVVLSELKISYQYVYTNFETKRVIEPGVNRLVSKRQLIGGGDVGFYEQGTEQNELSKISKVAGLCYGPTTILQNYIHDANVLMTILSPLKLQEAFKSLLEGRIEKIVKSEEKKYAKALKKK